MADIFDNFWDAIVGLLPTSPFAAIDLSGIDSEWLGWLNWFIPIRACLTIMAVWLAAIAAYYVYQMLLRWMGVIQ